ncbi:MAG TPA: spore cortex-lytic protein [Ruminococcaceae bacterium]|jgi:peptidoglycan hydrolase-like protein with peptidoglycan-binding domain|nr:spore cortex-lytic protein [Oscillospiraceae bacterium]
MPDRPIVPEFITVHLGKPNAAARNVRVPFAQYIKNVASSEIYPTWPENALRANIYAEITFALNRVYTEHYRSRGYDFDITNSTQFDQYYVEGRDIFENISRVVDDIFNDYVVKQGQIQPYFTQYCAGTCEGLSQWGTVALANQGYTPYRILQYYYGNDIDIVKNAPIKSNTTTYPGTPLRLGTGGEDVIEIQRELNRIAANYPSIPKISGSRGYFEQTTQNAVRQFQHIFNLESDGVVGKDTWYKIKRIYNGIKGLSELYSEGITISEAERKYERVLKKGSRGPSVKILQYYLCFLSYFNLKLPYVAVDGIFGDETRDAVLAFQSLYGLDVDGIVGRDTWDMIQNAYAGVLTSLPDEYRSYSSLLYPGYIITTGASGKVVEQLQTYLKTIADNNPSIPDVTVDGYYGEETKKAVLAVQKLEGIEQNGQVGVLTWNAIVNLYNQFR